MRTSTDRLEKHTILHASKSRVRGALTQANEFGAWLRLKLESDFAAGKHATGQVTYRGYEHLRFDVDVEKMEAESLFSFRWHPYAVDPKVAYSKEPTTLVEFRLEAVPHKTLLTIVESGFDRLQVNRRGEAMRMNSGGCETQMDNFRRHVGG